jgi:hypothetical protein
MNPNVRRMYLEKMQAVPVKHALRVVLDYRQWQREEP